MKRFFNGLSLCFSLVLLSVLVLGQAGDCRAASVRTYVVMPFNVNGPAGYKYLENSIPSMFNSRLHWAGNYELSPNESKTSRNPAMSEADAVKGLQASGADYVIWGNLMIVGEECSLDIMVMDKDGKKWPKSRQTRVAQLIPTLTSICDNISAEVFGKPGVRVVAVPSQQPSGNQSPNPDMVGSGLNPSFKYEGGSSSDSTRMRSQQLNYTGYGMEVCDADGDGRNEVFIFDDYNLFVYRWDNNRLAPLDNVRVNLTQNNIAIRSFDFDRSGRKQILLTSMDKEQMPKSRIYSFDGKKLKLEMENIRYFLNVIRDINTGREILIGQPGHTYEMFRKKRITEMVRTGNELIPGDPINLPDEFNVFSFAFLPAGRDITNEPRIISVSKLEKMKVWTLGGGMLSVTEDDWAGSPVGLEINPTSPGMGEDTESLRSLYYIPIRMIPVDLNRDGDYEMLIVKSITTTGHIFKRYRNFLQGEVKCMYWDGVGMTEQWRTRAVQGGIVDIALADFNNDGVLDLVVCANTGGVMTKRKTIVVGYSLNIDSDDVVSGSN
ncbi:VCBS repeat-containing protein [Desulfovibrio sp. OttesenSCG-928-C06]|nr:VCBS repeat-containing protein [Desulfovibrio sp. OttesenSCG-928-C06]